MSAVVFAPVDGLRTSDGPAGAPGRITPDIRRADIPARRVRRAPPIPLAGALGQCRSSLLTRC